jgi:Rad3-related DNA helicase
MESTEDLEQVEEYIPPELDLDTIDECFPKEQYREGQREAIEFAAKAFNRGVKIVIIEGPTGSGKSSIAKTLANMVSSSYYLTITKILQDQLTNDFDDITELKGRNAYPCSFWDRYGDKLVKGKLWTHDQLKILRAKHSDCANGFCRTKFNKGENISIGRCKKCFTTSGPVSGGRIVGDLAKLPGTAEYSACPYYEQVYQAVNSPQVTMNFSSFLFQTRMTKRFDEPRDLMILDEAHNVEQQLLGFVEITISDQDLQHHGIFLPQFELAAEYAAWFKDANLHKIIGDVIKEAQEEERTKLVDTMMRLLHKYKLFLSSIESDVEWVCTYEERKGSGGGTTHRVVTMKPVFVHTFTKPLLLKYAHQTLMMSATILDVNVLCRSLGIKKDQVAAYRMKNRFPKKNRPIYLQPVAKMTGGRSKMAEWAPKLSKKVNEICHNFENQRGIIHTHNFAIMDWLLRHCDDDVKSRFFNQRNFSHKGEMLEKHAQSENGVIIAPAMHEGIDLVDDLSRFQIICKVPFANFFEDEQLARRVELDRRYYLWITALKIVQAYGRSIRSETDYADTFILDESIYRFLDDTKKMMPGWFTEAIIDQKA